MLDEDKERVAKLLEFWFGAAGDADFDQPHAVWFKVDPDFDAALRERFLADHLRATGGDLASWVEERDGALALVLLLDQLPRNLYRGKAEAFSCDAKARETARRALARGFDQEMPPVRRSFLYLPFEHSEILADQDLSVRLFGSLPPGPETANLQRFAQRHHEIVERFGRFPHRNRALGRVSSAAEEAFLKEPFSAF